MNDTRTVTHAFLTSMGIVMLAVLAHTYMRSPVALLGYIFDALALTGITGSWIWYILTKISKRSRFSLALATFAGVSAIALLILMFVAGSNDPGFNWVGVTVGYVVSFLFWTGLHWTWHKTEGHGRRRQEQAR